jgi:hypothetical protein
MSEEDRKAIDLLIAQAGSKPNFKMSSDIGPVVERGIDLKHPSPVKIR